MLLKRDGVSFFLSLVFLSLVLQRSIILEVTDRATIKTLHALSEQRAKAELKVAHVVYEDGSIEEFGH